MGAEIIDLATVRRLRPYARALDYIMADLNGGRITGEQAVCDLRRLKAQFELDKQARAAAASS
jgi:hypothetical protein